MEARISSMDGSRVALEVCAISCSILCLAHIPEKSQQRLLRFNGYA
jgi:hypothetical protein